MQPNDPCTLSRVLTVLLSEKLAAAGFRHGFSTRAGGVSASPFDSLNLSASVGDDVDAVRENQRRFIESLGGDFERFVIVSQAHGANVVVVDRTVRPSDVARLEADALVAAPGSRAVLGIRVADCAPVILADTATGAVACVHVGWRGAVGRVLSNTVARLVGGFAVRPGNLLAAVGPHIRASSFEVGPEVAQQIAAEAHGRNVILPGYDKPHVDLTEVIFAQLDALGVSRDRVDDVGGDTFADATRFFSFRRDGKRSGRHLAAIVSPS